MNDPVSGSMNVDSYLYFIVALLPLSACMVVFQSNPYHALVLRGILGAVAALIYAVLGAGDVALTEALVGTLLAITLYAVAVRSSLVLRLGVLKDELMEAGVNQASGSRIEPLMAGFQAIFGKHHMRLEVVPYQDMQDLQQALIDREVHVICAQPKPFPQPSQAELQNGFHKSFQEPFQQASGADQPLYHTVTRVQRIHEMIQAELLPPADALTQLLLFQVNPPLSKEKHL